SILCHFPKSHPLFEPAPPDGQESERKPRSPAAATAPRSAVSCASATPPPLWGIGFTSWCEQPDYPPPNAVPPDLNLRCAIRSLYVEISASAGRRLYSLAKFVCTKRILP